MSEIDDRLTALGVDLPRPGRPAANYVPTSIVGRLLFVSGQLPLGPNGLAYAGKLGLDFSVEEGREAARLSAINILAQAKETLGDLALVSRVVRLNGFVNGAPDFDEPHKVLDGASDFLVEVLGDRGRHSRTVLVAANLPMNAATLIDAILETD